jgi:hypothetical protein
MAKTLLDLAARLERTAAKIETGANEIKKDVARAIIGDLIPATPVDTSRALSNWIANNGSAHNFSILPHVSGHFGSTRGVSMSAALAAALSVIEQAKPGVPIFITNNLLYIRGLNAGNSKQAPAGFVERSALVGRNVAKASKLKV